MRAEILAGSFVVAASVIGVRVFEHAAHSAAPSPSPSTSQSQPAPQFEPPLAASAQAAPAATGAYNPNWGEEVKIAAANDHQFYVKASVNASASSFLIDTGASFVALRDSDARLAGVYVAPSEFDRPVRTANGLTKAALVTLDAVEVDGLRVEHVPAFILPDDQLPINLLGMSFLSKLKSVEARGGELVLRG